MRISLISAAVLLTVTLTATSPRWTSTPPIPLPPGVTSSVLTDVSVVSPADVWTVGTGWGSGEDQPLAEHWDGSAWTSITVPTSSASTYLNAIDAINTGDVWAVGSAESGTGSTGLVLHYSGGTWVTEPTPALPAGSRGILNDVDIRTVDDGWAVGQITSGIPGSRPLVLQRRSGEWVAVAVPISALPVQLNSVFAASATDVWVAGVQTPVGGHQVPLILHFDGRTWNRVTLPADAGHDQSLQSVAASSAGDVWAAGSSCGNVSPTTCTPLGPVALLVSHVCPTWLFDGGMTVEGVLAEKFAVLRPVLDERQWRLLLGVEAQALGHGGIAVVARASGAARSTVSIGLRQVRVGVVCDGRVRAPGAGRPRVGEVQPGVEQALQDLVAPATRGDPMSLLRWTTKSLRSLVGALDAAGFVVSTRTVARMLRRLGYRLHAVFKTKEGGQHPDRDAQFCYIDALAGQFVQAGDPVVSLDCKKKELVGEYANKGREYQPLGCPVKVNGHDFPAGVPKAIPYGVYDIGADEGWVSVGVDHETSAFAVNTLRTWWNSMGKARYPQAKRLMLTADGGGSNGYRRRAFKVELAAFAAETGLDVTVCHFPPGTSKWNKIEHKMFSFISINWRGRPLTDYQTILELIAHTTTETGLTVSACLDDGVYPTGVKVTNAELAAVPLVPQDFHGEWNYTISCGRTRKPRRGNKSSIK